MVNLTRIYTRTGDAGETRLGDMSTTSKTDHPIAISPAATTAHRKTARPPRHEASPTGACTG